MIHLLVVVFWIIIFYSMQILLLFLDSMCDLSDISNNMHLTKGYTPRLTKAIVNKRLIPFYYLKDFFNHIKNLK